MEKLFTYFSKAELALWLSSLSIIIVTFLIFDRANYLRVASVIRTSP